MRLGQGLVDGDHLVGGAGEWAQKQQVFLVARMEDPLAAAALHNGIRIHFLKLSLHLFGCCE